MLTTTRINSRPTLQIGDDIKLHITIENGQAKVPSDAPREVKVRLGELRWRKDNER